MNLVLLTLALGQDRAASQKNVDTVVQTVSWRTDWDEVRRDAAESGKPIFWLNIVGQLGGST